MGEGFKILDAYVEVRADASGVGDDAARQIRGQQSTFSRAGSGLGSSLMGGMQGVIGGLVGGVTAAFATPLINGVNQAISSVMATAKTAIFDYNSTLEQANIGFTTILGSADKARGMLSDLQKFARETPFEFADVTTATQRLLAMGVSAKDVIPYLTAIGDAAAGLGSGQAGVDRITTAIGQMSAKTKVQGDEILQLTEAGVPALRILAESYGVTAEQIGDMITRGNVLSKDAVPLLIKGLEKGTKTTAGFGGMMEKQSKTMTGAMSNIKDSINQTLSGAFLPLFKIVERVTVQISKFATSKTVQRWAKDTAKSMEEFVDTFGAGIKETFADPKVQKALKDFGRDFSKSIKDAGPDLKKILPDLIKFGKDALPGIIEGVGKLVKALPALAKDLRSITHDLSTTGKEFGDTAKAVGQFVKDTAEFLRDLDANWLNFKHKWFKTRDEITAALLSWPSDWVKMGNDIVQGFINGVTARFEDAKTAVANLASTVSDTFFKLLQFGSPSRLFQKYGMWVGQGLNRGLLGSVDQIKSAGEKLADAVDKPMRAGVERVTKRLVALAKTRDAVIEKLATAKDVLSGLRDDRAGYKQGVRDNIMGSGDITGLFEAATSSTVSSSAAAGRLDGRAYQASYTSSTTTTSPGGLSGVRAKLRALVGNTKAFTTNLKKLVGMGLDHFSVQELISAGPTVSLPITTELLADKAGFNDLVPLQRQLNSASSALGEYGAGYTYDSKISSAASTVNRLRDRRDNITAVMIVEARKIDEVDKVVKAVNALAKTAKAKKAGAKK